MKDESTVSQEVQIQARYYNCNLLRNNSGALKDKDGRLVRYGLGNVSKKHTDNMKSSDLIGFTKVTITKDMIGQEIAVFTALEIKKEAWSPSKKFDKREKAQNNFINWIKNNGGIASFCNSINQLKNILRS